jgi:hypothetical protein
MKSTQINTNEIDEFWSPVKKGDTCVGTFQDFFKSKYNTVLLVKNGIGIIAINESATLAGVSSNLKKGDYYEFTFLGVEESESGNKYHNIILNSMESENEKEDDMLNKRYKKGIFRQE